MILLVVALLISAIAIVTARSRRALLSAVGRRPGAITSWMDALGEAPAIGALLGATWRGLWGAWVGCLAAVSFVWFRDRRAVRRIAILHDEAAPKVARGLAAQLRAGHAFEGAMAAVAAEGSILSGTLDEAVRGLRAGQPRERVLDQLQVRAAGDGMRQVVDTLRIGLRAGADLPSVLDLVADGCAERHRIARDRRSAAAQARLSAIVVGSMPLAFLAMTSGSETSPARMLFTEPLGYVLLVVGMGLEATGILWIKRLA
ncbi:MAG: type II secretion system F family protein [Actinomycetota bacterium]